MIFFGIDLKPARIINRTDQVVVVDSNYLVGLPHVNPENIVQFIDHHAVTESEKICKHANFQIEMVGAAATLIAEKFQKNKLEISRESSILLYYGIISNTINLKAKVTTPKDLEMAKWLQEQCKEISREKVEEIFMKKSQIRDGLRKEMEVQVVWKWKDKTITIGQLEYANIEAFLAQKETEIREILKTVKQENQLDYIIVNCVDTLNGYSTILAIDEQTEMVIEDLLKIKFVNQKAKFNELVLRKEIFRQLESRG